MRKGAFVRAALSDFRRAGTLFPSSRAVSAEIGRVLGDDRNFVVEYGAGDGAVTREILNSLSPDGRLLALEINPGFSAALAEIDDPRLYIKRQDVLRFLNNGLAELPPADAVVSGIPLSFLDPPARREVIARSRSLLAPGGLFVVYQASPFFFRALQAHFPSARMHFSLQNFLPPYFIAVARRD